MGDRIYAAEPLLSALEGCGVDNARIEVELRSGSWSGSEPEDESIFGDEEAEGIEDAAGSGSNRSDASNSAQTDPTLEGQEMPVSDGSALFWAEMIKQVRVRTAPTQDGGESATKKAPYAPSKVFFELI